MALLKSKLRIPRLVNILSRERLCRLFENTDNTRLVSISAGAGYGKTTLAAEAFALKKESVIWYRLDELDRDFGVFMDYLELAFSLKFSNAVFRTEIGISEQNWEGSCRMRLRERLNGFTACLEETVRGQSFLILDDFHLVDQSPDICRAVEYLLDILPANILVVLLTRKEVPLKLSRFRAGGQLIEITEGELAFTQSETRAFYARISTRVSEENIGDILEKTGGWAASLVLLKYALKDKSPEEMSKQLAGFRGSQRHVFSYLEENFFAAQPEETRTFMLKANLLPEIDVKKCEAVFLIINAREMLDRLVKAHLLVFPSHEGADVFYFHHLLKDFLSVKLKQQFSAVQIREFHRKIAVVLESENTFEALDHIIRAQDFEAAVRMIETHEIKFLLQGNLLFVEQCIKNIPEEIRNKRPMLLYFQAQLLSYYGLPDQAMGKLKTALRLCRSQNAVDEELKCMVDLGSLYYFTGHVKEAKLLMEQVLEKVDEQSNTYVIVMTFLIFLSSALGEFERARAYTARAKQVILDYPEFEGRVAMVLIRTSETYYHYIRGDYPLSQDVNRKLLKSANDLGVEACLPLVYYQCAATCSRQREFEKGLEFALQGIAVCEKMALGDSKKGWIYLAGAENYLGLGRPDAAIGFIDQGIELFEAPGNRWGLANAWELKARCLLDHDTASAKAYLNDAFDIITSYGLTLTRGLLENTMARVMIREKDYTGAMTLLANARPRLERVKFHLFENYLLSAKAMAGQNRDKEAGAYVAKALALSEEKQYHRWVEKEKTGGNPQGRQPAGMTVNMLGRFSIAVNNKELDLAACKSTKALTIFKYLAAHPESGFSPREVLIELLWPEEDIRKTGKRFNMAMSSLRRLLEPDLPSKAPSSYIRRRKDTYCLGRPGQVSSDMQLFLTALHTAETCEKEAPGTGLASRLKAELCYAGAFLAEDPYEEWCIPIRESLELSHLRNLWAVLTHFESQGEYKAAIDYGRKILNIDPFDENTYEKLMKLYCAVGRPSDIAGTYQTYREKMHIMDCPVDSRMADLYEKLILGSAP